MPELFTKSLTNQYVIQFFFSSLFYQVLRSDNNMRNSDVELQQRSIEYLCLSSLATADVLVSYLILCLFYSRFIMEIL